MLAMQVLFVFELLMQRIAFLGREPTSIARTILQQREDDDAQEDCWNAPKNIDTLPAFQTKEFRMMHSYAVDGFVGSNFEQRVRNLGADDLGNWCRDQEARQRSRPVPARKPLSEIDNDAGQKYR